MDISLIAKVEQDNKTSIKKRARRVVALAFVTASFMFILQFVCLIFIPTTDNKVIYDLFLALSYVIYIVIPFGLTALFYKKHFSINNKSEIKRIIIKRPILFVAGAIGTVMLINLIVNLLFGWFLNDFTVDDMTQPTTSVAEILIGYFSMALLPALLEEWAFRGILLKYLRPYSKIGALVTTSIIFGMMHVDLPRIISASIFGLILGICYDYTGSIKLPVIIHFLNNTLALTATYAQSNPLLATMVGLLFMVLMVCGVWAIIFYARNGIADKGISFAKPSVCGYKLPCGSFLKISAFNAGLILFVPIFAFYFILVYFV